MKKRLSVLFICVSLVFALAFSAFGLELFNDQHPPRVVDDADLLNDYEEEQLAAMLDEISERHLIDVVVVTANVLGGKSPMEYADDFFDYNGYGFQTEGDITSGDGILFLLSMEDRDWWISTKGRGYDALYDDDIQYIGNMMLDDLSGGDYYSAFCTYANLCDQALESAKNGYSGGFSSEYDNGYYDSGSRSQSSGALSVLKRAAASLFIGLFIALIITGSMKNKLKTVRFQSGAADYAKRGSMQLTRSEDIFLYSTVNRVKKPDDDSRSGGSHSSHSSSSGSSHGGGGGKF